MKFLRRAGLVLVVLGLTAAVMLWIVYIIPISVSKASATASSAFDIALDLEKLKRSDFSEVNMHEFREGDTYEFRWNRLGSDEFIEISVDELTGHVVSSIQRSGALGYERLNVECIGGACKRSTRDLGPKPIKITPATKSVTPPTP
jgi:hypothetical protein